MRRRVGLLAAVLVAVAGCGGSSHPAARERATLTPTAAPASGRGCGEDASVGARAIRFRTSDGVTLSGAVVGSGPAAAVVIHEYPLDYCGWLSYARYLSRHGVRALLFDLRCFGQSAYPGGRGHAVTDVAAAMEGRIAGERARSRWSAPRWAARSRSSPPPGCTRPRSSTSRASATRRA